MKNPILTLSTTLLIAFFSTSLSAQEPRAKELHKVSESETLAGTKKREMSTSQGDVPRLTHKGASKNPTSEKAHVACTCRHHERSEYLIIDCPHKAGGSELTDTIQKKQGPSETQKDVEPLLDIDAMKREKSKR